MPLLTKMLVMMMTTTMDVYVDDYGYELTILRNFVNDDMMTMMNVRLDLKDSMILNQIIYCLMMS